MTWKKPTTTGTGPRRAGHAMIPIGKKIFILGGVNKGVFYNDLHIFDTGFLPFISFSSFLEINSSKFVRKNGMEFSIYSRNNSWL